MWLFYLNKWGLNLKCRKPSPPWAKIKLSDAHHMKLSVKSCYYFGGGRTDSRKTSGRTDILPKDKCPKNEWPKNTWSSRQLAETIFHRKLCLTKQTSEQKKYGQQAVNRYYIRPWNRKIYQRIFNWMDENTVNWATKKIRMKFFHINAK